MAWWLQHLLLTNMAGGIFHSQELLQSSSFPETSLSFPELTTFLPRHKLNSVWICSIVQFPQFDFFEPHSSPHNWEKKKKRHYWEKSDGFLPLTRRGLRGAQQWYLEELRIRSRRKSPERWNHEPRKEAALWFPSTMNWLWIQAIRQGETSSLKALDEEKWDKL